MKSLKRKKKSKDDLDQGINESSYKAKLAMLLFGIGPILLMGWFLWSNGFFD